MIPNLYIGYGCFTQLVVSGSRGSYSFCCSLHLFVLCIYVARVSLVFVPTYRTVASNCSSKHSPWNDQTVHQIPKQMRKKHLNMDGWKTIQLFFGPSATWQVYILAVQSTYRLKYPVFFRPKEVLFIPNHSISRNSIRFIMISFLNFPLNFRKHKLSGQREWTSHLL